MFQVALIGAGKMGEAMIKGWLESNTFTAADIIVSDKDGDRKDHIAETYSVSTAKDNEEAVLSSNTVILAVKPQDSDEALDGIAGAIKDDSLLISIVAGLSIDSMREVVGPEPSIVRVMPNVAALVKAAVSAYAVEAGPSGLKKEYIERILGALGETVEVDERWMDLITGLSGSGPAYYFLLVELLEEIGVRGGLDREVARKLARETLWGAAKLLKETGREASELREAVSSPGGTTLAALDKLDEAGFGEVMERAVDAARARAGELAL